MNKYSKSGGGNKKMIEFEVNKSDPLNSISSK